MKQSISKDTLSTSNPLSQQGVTLIVALVMLLVMTSLGVTTMSGSTLQERMAGNSREQDIARVNAEAALRAAEAALQVAVDANVDDNAMGLFIDNNNSPGGWYAPIQIGTQFTPGVSFTLTDEDAWVDANSETLNGINGANNARYIVEYLGKRDTRNTFRVTAIAWGNRDSTVSILQSYYIPAN